MHSYTEFTDGLELHKGSYLIVRQKERLILIRGIYVFWRSRNETIKDRQVVIRLGGLCVLIQLENSFGCGIGIFRIYIKINYSQICCFPIDIYPVRVYNDNTLRGYIRRM